jgi:hypothetical protein
MSELDCYVYGTKEDHAELARKMRDGDADAERRLEEIIAHQEAHSTPLLGQIYENFPNGTMNLSIAIGDALRALG